MVLCPENLIPVSAEVLCYYADKAVNCVAVARTTQ